MALRVATDKDWLSDVRHKQFWADDVNKRDKSCTHYMYRGEAVFFGLFSPGSGSWRFGLKDLSLSSTHGPNNAVTKNKMNQFPLRFGKDTEDHLKIFEQPNTGGKNKAQEVLKEESDVEKIMAAET